MEKFTPKDWGAVLVLVIMFAVVFLADISGLVDDVSHPLIREPIQELPMDDGGAISQTSYTDAASRASEPFRLRPRI